MKKEDKEKEGRKRKPWTEREEKGRKGGSEREKEESGGIDPWESGEFLKTVS